MSKTPLKSSFIFKREFKIYPIPFEGYPEHSRAKHFPLILDTYTSDELVHDIPDDMKDIQKTLNQATNQSNKTKQILNLLTSLTNFRFFTYNATEAQWSFELPQNSSDITDDINNVSSRWALCNYYWPGQKNAIDYSFRKNDFKPEIYIDHKKYFTHNPFEDSKAEITFPNTINLALESYFSLDKKTKNMVDSVAYLISNSIDLRDSMKSMSFLSSVSAIETLINFEYKSKSKGITFKCHDCKSINDSPYKCHKCGNPIWGIAFKFREFLTCFVSASEESIKKYKKIYGIRSKITHDGLLLVGDDEINWSTFGAKDDFLIHTETLQISRLALHNWLICQLKTTEQNE